MIDAKIKACKEFMDGDDDANSYSFIVGWDAAMKEAKKKVRIFDKMIEDE